jgi:hypothetical protein
MFSGEKARGEGIESVKTNAPPGRWQTTRLRTQTVQTVQWPRRGGAVLRVGMRPLRCAGHGGAPKMPACPHAPPLPRPSARPPCNALMLPASCS